MPSPGTIRNGEDVHAIVQAFTLVPTSQTDVSIRMLKRPFVPAIARIINDGGYPAIANRQSKAENLVLLSVDQYRPTMQGVRDALAADGKVRGLPWKLCGNEGEIVRLDTLKAEPGIQSLRAENHEGNFKIRRIVPPKWLISFKDSQEAHRFVRSWHRHPFPMQRGRSIEGEMPPVMNAEILW